MQIRFGQSQVSALSRVSAVEGRPLSGIPLYTNTNSQLSGSKLGNAEEDSSDKVGDYNICW